MECEMKKHDWLEENILSMIAYAENENLYGISMALAKAHIEVARELSFISLEPPYSRRHEQSA